MSFHWSSHDWKPSSSDPAPWLDFLDLLFPLLELYLSSWKFFAPLERNSLAFAPCFFFLSSSFSNFFLYPRPAFCISYSSMLAILESMRNCFSIAWFIILLWRPSCLLMSKIRSFYWSPTFFTSCEGSASLSPLIS
jgi:hypothetical protein